MRILVDYDNQKVAGFGSRNPAGRPPSLRDHELNIDALRRGLIKFREDHLPSSIQELSVRLYGGWYADGDGRETDAANMLARILRNIGRRERTTRFAFELARQPLATSTPLYATLRLTPWSGKNLRFRELPDCHLLPSSCAAIATLKSWARRGKCPQDGCSVHTKDFVFQLGQKMVDTLMVADVVFSAHKESVPIAVVSMDDDMVPGLLTAAEVLRPTDFFLLRFGRRHPSPYDPLLESVGVTIVDYAPLQNQS